MVPRRASLVLAALVNSFLVLSASLLLIGRLDAAPATPATTVVLSAIRSAYTDEGAPDAKLGGESWLNLGRYDFQGTPYRRFVYVEFDLSSIPIGADVAGAKLRLFQQSAGGVDPYWVWPWTAPAAWSEGNITWNNQPWPAYPNAATVGLTLASGTWQEWDVSPIVQDWIQAGKPNYGIVLAGDTTTFSDHVFDPRGGKSPPQLEIAYTAAGDPPDLVVTDLWKEGSQVHFQVRNVGYGQAPAPVYAHLQINSQPVEDSSLGAVAAWTCAEGGFPSPLNCSGESVMATVCAEVTGAVDPNPGDNCLSKELLCDTTPPAFGGAPAVKDIGSSQATVCWTAAEKTTGRVLFDRLSGLWGQTASDGISAVDHCVTLSKLEAAAGYHYLVEIQDANGNAARSKPGTFSTAVLPDGQSPMLSAQIPKVISGTTTLLATANDNTGINRIRFMLDGKPAQTCYGPQCVFALDSTLLADGAHNIAVQAVDPAGNVTEFPAATQIRNSLDHMLSPVHVALVRPTEGSQVYGQVQVVAEVNHDLGLPLSRVEFLVNGSIVQTATYPPCPRISYGTFCEGRTPLRETFTLDVSSRTPGAPLVLSARAYDGQTPANWNETQRHVTVVSPPTPALALSRRVTWVGSHFDVELSIQNTGSVAIRPVSFTDRSRGFQAAGTMQLAGEEPGPWGTRMPCAVSDERRLETSEIACQFTPWTLDPGRTRRVRYVLIPVIPNDAPTPVSIGEQLQFSYESVGRQYQAQRTDLGVESSATRAAALRESDYVIATSAETGFVYADPADTNRLFAARAELAEVRSGVFGDLTLSEINSPETVKRKFSAWAPFLRPQWLASGYLLLTPVIPCKDLPTIYFTKDTQGLVRCSDNWYADTLGGDGLPNLRVGRLLGIYVDEAAWIRNSLQVVRGERSFDRSQAMMVSGPEGSWEYFALGVVWGADNLRRASPPTNNINFVHEELYATPISLRRDSLAILGTRWNCPGAARMALPAQLSHLRHLTCRWDYDDKTALPAPPTDLATLQSLISQADAILVQNAYRPGLTLPYQIFGTGANDNADWALAHDAAVNDVTRALPESDIYYWSGHGAPGAWTQFTRGSFGSTSGVVLSNSCLTGKWSGLYAQSAPESAAQAGAAVFIGSTEVSPVGPADWATIMLPTYTWQASRSAGEALVQAKWAIGTGSAPGFTPGHCPPYYDLVIHEFNLYGDPKFGAIASAESTGALIPAGPIAESPAQPEETVQVTIPAYEMTQEAGVHRVTIPDGMLTTEVGRPEIPYYVYRRAVPAGQRVQNVRIVSRSEPAALTDLIVPVFAANILDRPAAQVDPISPDEWYPAGDLAWNQTTTAAGSEELAVTLYPFRYNLARGEGRFYASYTLEIITVPGTVSIVRLDTDVPQYRQGQPVNLTLKLEAHTATNGLMFGVAVENTTTGETI